MHHAQTAGGVTKWRAVKCCRAWYANNVEVGAQLSVELGWDGLRWPSAAVHWGGAGMGCAGFMLPCMRGLGWTALASCCHAGGWGGGWDGLCWLLPCMGPIQVTHDRAVHSPGPLIRIGVHPLVPHLRADCRAQPATSRSPHNGCLKTAHRPRGCGLRPCAGSGLPPFLDSHARISTPVRHMDSPGNGRRKPGTLAGSSRRPPSNPLASRERGCPRGAATPQRRIISDEFGIFGRSRSGSCGGGADGGGSGAVAATASSAEAWRRAGGFFPEAGTATLSLPQLRPPAAAAPCLDTPPATTVAAAACADGRTERPVRRDDVGDVQAAMSRAVPHTEHVPGSATKARISWVGSRKAKREGEGSLVERQCVQAGDMHAGGMQVGCGAATVACRRMACKRVVEQQSLHASKLQPGSASIKSKDKSPMIFPCVRSRK
eukprot:79989-Chlamydomonas_euryale.AAC.9